GVFHGHARALPTVAAMAAGARAGAGRLNHGATRPAKAPQRAADRESSPERAVRLAPAPRRQRNPGSRLLHAAGPGPDVVPRQVRAADPARSPDQLERAGRPRRRAAVARIGETAR